MDSMMDSTLGIRLDTLQGMSQDISEGTLTVMQGFHQYLNTVGKFTIRGINLQNFAAVV